jgi:hypothetical protein
MAINLAGSRRKRKDGPGLRRTPADAAPGYL